MSNPQVPTQQPKRLTRSNDDKWLAGVCGGIAEYFGLDPALVRVAFVLSLLLPGPQVLVYLVLWVVMPKGDRPLPPPPDPYSAGGYSSGTY